MNFNAAISNNNTPTTFFQNQIKPRAQALKYVTCVTLYTPLAIIYNTFINTPLLCVMDIRDNKKTLFNYHVIHKHVDLFGHRFYTSALKIINPNSKIDEINYEPFLNKINDILDKFLKKTIQNYNLKKIAGKSTLKEKVIRTGIALAKPILRGIARVVDTALGLVAAALSLLSLGTSTRLNSFAAKNLNLLSACTDLTDALIHISVILKYK